MSKILFYILIRRQGSTSNPVLAKSHIAKNNYYRLKDDSVLVDNPMRTIINRIGKVFHREWGKDLTITDGIRTPKAQATAMYNNFEKEGGVEKQRKIYRNKKLFDQIADAYEKNKDSTIEKMSKVIESQVKNGNLISKHLNKKAFDIRTNDLKPEELAYLISILEKKHNCLFFQDKSKHAEPHIHVQINTGC